MKKFILVNIFLLGACTQNTFDSLQKRTFGVAPIDSQESDLIPEADTRTPTQLLCQRGPEITNVEERGDFQAQFALICAGGDTNQTFEELVSTAYSGEKEGPQIAVLKREIGELQTTSLILAYGIKVPEPDPTRLVAYKAHDILGTVQNNRSIMDISVDGREDFPGKKSVEKVTLTYNLKVAKGAALFDQRHAEFNTYLLSEKESDIVVSTENQMKDSPSANYFKNQSIVVGVKVSESHSVLLFLSDLVVIGRLDPERLENALIDINIEVANSFFKHFSGIPLEKEEVSELEEEPN